MKKIILFNLLLSLMACTQKKQQVAISQPSQQKSEIEDGKIKSDSSSKDSTAIGNICLNVTREEFEKQRKTFINETPKLGELKIKSVSGLFYNDRLAAVQIISHQQDYYKKGTSGDGWEMMYIEKYGTQYISKGNIFNYEKDMKGITVTDLSSSDKPFSSFEQFMENKISACYRNDRLCSEEEIDSIFDPIYEIWPLMFERKLSKLSKYRIKYYKKKINEIKERYRKNPTLGDADYIVSKQIISQELRKEINDIIERNNEINTEKHKNDPSWSVIVVAYLPLCDKYKNDKIIKESKIRHSKEAERKRELNKI